MTGINLHGFWIEPIRTDAQLAAQQRGMLEDIQTTLTLAELRALAGLESEYPMVFVPEIRQAFHVRQRLLEEGLVSSRHKRLCVTGDQHPVGFYGKVCRLCCAVRNVLRRKR